MQKIEPERSFDLEREIKSLPPKRAAAATIVNEEEAMNEESELNNNGPDVDVRGEERGYVLGEGEAIDTPLRPEEKRRLNWEGGLYLAPLTTVGNLVRLEFHLSLVVIELTIDALVLSISFQCHRSTSTSFLPHPILSKK